MDFEVSDRRSRGAAAAPPVQFKQIRDVANFAVLFILDPEVVAREHGVPSSRTLRDTADKVRLCPFWDVPDGSGEDGDGVTRKWLSAVEVLGSTSTPRGPAVRHFVDLVRITGLTWDSVKRHNDPVRVMTQLSTEILSAVNLREDMHAGSTWRVVGLAASLDERALVTRSNDGATDGDASEITVGMMIGLAEKAARSPSKIAKVGSSSTSQHRSVTDYLELTLVLAEVTGMMLGPSNEHDSVAESWRDAGYTIRAMPSRAAQVRRDASKVLAHTWAKILPPAVREEYEQTAKKVAEAEAEEAARVRAAFEAADSDGPAVP